MFYQQGCTSEAAEIGGRVGLSVKYTNKLYKLVLLVLSQLT